MKFVNQSATYVSEQDPLKCIEIAGKITHKSELKDEKKFLIDMLRMGHTATLEFGSVYIETHYASDFSEHYDVYRLNTSNNPAIHISTHVNGYKIYTNLRYLLEKCPELFVDYINDNLQYCFKFTPDRDNPYRRLTYHIITNRGISHELVRHRIFSFMQESTRYCNYSKGKFNNEITCISPNHKNDYQANRVTTILEDIENVYLHLTEDGMLAQQARGILPNDLKTELYMCGFLKDWIGHNVEAYAIDIFDQSVDVTTRLGFDTLRRDKAAHPQAREIAEIIFEDIIIQVGASKFNEIKESYYE